VSCCRGAAAGMIRQGEIDQGLVFEIEYAGGRTITVIGATTRRRYTFSGLDRLQHVDPRDAAGLLRERVFRLNRVIRPKAG
jgi:hypothetical protein